MSSKTFDQVLQAFCQSEMNNYRIPHILHLLEDFLTIDAPSDGGKRTIAIMMIIFKRLNIPVDRYKINRICEFISKIYRKRKCTKRELLCYLNFACVPGCTFVSYLFKLYTSVNDLHHHVYLNMECRTDLEFWMRFLSNLNGITYILQQGLHLKLNYGTCYRCIVNERLSQRRLVLFFVAIRNRVTTRKIFSMAFFELYPIVIAAILWGSRWS